MMFQFTPLYSIETEKDDLTLEIFIIHAMRHNIFDFDNDDNREENENE